MAVGYRKKIRNLLKKGSLTGFETASIVMSQLYDLEKIVEPELYGLEGVDIQQQYKDASVLTTEEIDSLKDSKLKGHDDKIEEYNNWLGAFSSFISLVYCARVYYLQIRNLLSLPLFLFADNSYLSNLDAPFCERSNHKVKTFLIYQILETKHLISLFLFRKTLLNVVSEITGIKFCDQVDRWYEEIKIALNDYKDALNGTSALSDGAKHTVNDALLIISLEELQMNPRLQEKFRERLSKPLERDKWVYECQMDFIEEMKEKAKNRVFEHTDNSVHG